MLGRRAVPVNAHESNELNNAFLLPPASGPHRSLRVLRNAPRQLPSPFCDWAVLSPGEGTGQSTWRHICAYLSQSGTNGSCVVAGRGSAVSWASPSQSSATLLSSEPPDAHFHRSHCLCRCRHGPRNTRPRNRLLSISTVAIVNAANSRFVCTAGTSANCIVGAVSLLALRRIRTFAPLAYFLWTFGVFNLLNSGYLVSSAIGHGSDDWTKVIAGLSPS